MWWVLRHPIMAQHLNFNYLFVLFRCSVLLGTVPGTGTPRWSAMSFGHACREICRPRHERFFKNNVSVLKAHYCFKNSEQTKTYIMWNDSPGLECVTEVHACIPRALHRTVCTVPSVGNARQGSGIASRARLPDMMCFVMNFLDRTSHKTGNMFHNFFIPTTNIPNCFIMEDLDSYNDAKRSATSPARAGMIECSDEDIPCHHPENSTLKEPPSHAAPLTASSAEDSSSTRSDGVRRNDVLCGRGGRSNVHPGNRLFRRLVNHNRRLYQNSDSPLQKHYLIVSIIIAIERTGGRFLRKDENNRWERVTPSIAHRKTAQA